MHVEQDFDAEVRDARPEDLAAVLLVQKRAHARHAGLGIPVPPLSETFSALQLDAARRTLLVGVVRGSIAGSIRFAVAERTCTFDRLSVDPRLQGAGLGRQLVRAMEARCAAVADASRVTIPANVRVLRRFYESLGYRASSKPDCARSGWQVMARPI